MESNSFLRKLEVCENTGLNKMEERWDREGGREMQEGGDMGIYVYV